MVEIRVKFSKRFYQYIPDDPIDESETIEWQALIYIAQYYLST